MEIPAEIVGCAIRRLRLGREETQRTCADRGGVDRSTWCLLEKGQRSGASSTIERVARGLEVETAELEMEVIAEWVIAQGAEEVLSRLRQRGVGQATSPVDVPVVVVESEGALRSLRAVVISLDGLGGPLLVRGARGHEARQSQPAGPDSAVES